MTPFLFPVVIAQVMITIGALVALKYNDLSMARMCLGAQVLLTAAIVALLAFK
jgi:hypothetical protein